MVNYFNYNPQIEVPFNIFIASENITKMHMNYMVNPNNVICNVQSKMTEHQQIIGLLSIREDKTNFYITNVNIGKSITARNDDYIEKSRRYMFNYYNNIITLREVLKSNGVEIIKMRDDADIDLSYENLEKDTIINLFK